MISFTGFKSRNGCQGIKLLAQNANNSRILLWSEQYHSHTEVYIYDFSSITVYQKTIRSIYKCLNQNCFSVLFSFHPKRNVPQKLSGGLYNCSAGNYWSFQHHLDCNLKVECEDGRDETGHCSYSSPACQGWVAARNKCFTIVSPESLRTFQTGDNSFVTKARRYCASLNASLGQPKEFVDFKLLLSAIKGLKHDKHSKIMFGLFHDPLSVPNIYTGNVIADDKTVLHHTINDYLGDPSYTREKLCLILKNRDKFVSKARSADFDSDENVYAACEYSLTERNMNHNESTTISLQNVSFEAHRQKQNLTRCLDGQVTHTFLSGGPHNACGQDTISPCLASDCPENSKNGFFQTNKGFESPAVFTCGNGVTRLSYTLVCDFRHHCWDGSDELFCKHPSCDTFTCTNGQCFSSDKHCDIVSDCVDSSDEMTCTGDTGVYTYWLLKFRSPVLIQFDGTRAFTIKNMNSTDSCPATHYRCPGEYNDCLPVYTQCNGWYDCMGHEDEEGCEGRTCHGFYRCFNSTICVHTDHLCDGWPHCPQRDDEWLCDVICPVQCLCQGHAFLCPQPFSAHLFPQLRYLDAQGSALMPSDLQHNPYLLHLILSRCKLNTFPLMVLQNLLFLDLSDNHLEIANMSVFARFPNLRTLILAGNPIYLLHNEPDSSLQQSALKAIDLSYTNLSMFESKLLSNFIFVQTLNLSFSLIRTVGTTGFQHMPKLRNLYMKVAFLKTFPADMFKTLSHLRIITASTYKLCCKELLPHQFELIVCSAPKDEMSSCADLLQTETYRAFLWLISFLSLLGNMFCLVVRVCVRSKTSAGGFNVFVANLSVSDLLMGVYIAIIGVADTHFRGKYLFYDDSWKQSVSCKVAGFLSLLSCEVSALTIWLITLDRFIVLRFPFSSVRFQRTSATVACLITWVIGWLLASIPLLPMTSHWEFFSQTGICIPLPVTRQNFKGKTYSVSVFIVLNFVLFIFVATGQAFIYWSVKRNALNTDSTKVSRDLTVARRLISVAVTDFLCWFPIGLCGLLASASTPIPVEVNVGLAIFVLPLNSALNPFMYTFNMVMEKRRKAKEAILLKWLALHTELLENE